MKTIKKQYYGIKFPFTANNLDGFFLDMNSKFEDKIASEIAHVLLTPKRSRIRQPEFGTDIIKHLFEMNDEMTWDSVLEEARVSVSRFVPNAEIESIEVVIPDEEPNSQYLDIRYVAKKGNKSENNRMAIKL